MMYAQVLVFLFLIRCRFPRSKSIAAILRERYGNPVLNQYRRLERLDFRKRKLECDVNYLTTCKQQDLIPRFAYFKLYKRQLKHSRLYRSCQRRFLDLELRNKRSELRQVNEKLNILHNELKQAVNILDFNHLLNLIERKNNESISHVKFIHRNKLNKLGYVDNDGIPHDKVIFNYSNRHLNDSERSVLAKGLNYVVASNRLDFIDNFSSFEMLFKQICTHEFYDNNQKGFNFFKSSLKNLAFKNFYDRKPNFVFNLTKEEQVALKNLSLDRSIIIMKPDKGNGIVILNKGDYTTKMLTILNDTSKFVTVKDDVLIKLLNTEDKINRFLRQLKKDNIINGQTYSKLYCSGSKPGIMYGLPKVHKDNCPLRPIMSALGTFNYHLAKFLVPILAPITQNVFTVSDSFNFSKELGNLNIENCVMASFDVKSLFTNIPLKETIDICIENLFKDETTVHNFNRKQLHQLLSFAATDCYFLFNEQVYKQVDGCAMGNPCGPTLANAFLSHHEVNWLNNCPIDFKPLFYRRYIDDTFMIFKSEEHIPLFLNYLNSQHPNIEFTSEIESEGKLPFLDINISRSNSTFSTSVYKKPTFTGLMTKFSSFVPIDYKRNLISTLVTRAYRICSDYFALHSQLQLIKDTLHLNGFAKNFTDSYIGKRLNLLLNPPEKKPTVKKAVVYFPITFTGKNSFSLKNKLSKLLNEFYPQITARVIFKPGRSIKSFFRFKDVVPLSLQSSVVYKYTCHCCNAMYIGKTKRQLTVRIHEHLGRSVRTNRPITNPPFSAIRTHAHTSDHPIKKGSFEILATSSRDMELCVRESLLTIRDKPSLSNNEKSTELLCF